MSRLGKDALEVDSYLELSKQIIFDRFRRTIEEWNSEGVYTIWNRKTVPNGYYCDTTTSEMDGRYRVCIFFNRKPILNYWIKSQRTSYEVEVDEKYMKQLLSK